MNIVTEASKPKDYKVKGRLLFKKLDTETVRRHIRSCPALKNAKTGPGIKSLVIIKLGGFGRTYREYVGEIAGYVTCNSKGEVLSRWVSPKAKNFGIDAKLDAFVKKPVIENWSCFVTRETPVNEGLFDKAVNAYAKGIQAFATKNAGPDKDEKKTCDYPDGEASFRRAKIDYKKNLSGKYTKLTDYTELIYFKYPENLCKNIAKKYAKPSSEFFVHTSNPFGNKHLGEFMVGGDDGFAYCPELNKWFQYNVEKKVPIDINRPVSFSYIQTFAKKQINENYVSVALKRPVTEALHGEELPMNEVKRDVKFVEGEQGTPNSVLLINGKQYRVRVETLIVRDLHGEPHVLYEKRDKPTSYGLTYKLPGGSIEPHKAWEEQAAAECNEEVRMKVKNLRYTGVSYVTQYPPGKKPDWQRASVLFQKGVDYAGAVTFVFIAEYDGPYNKYVKKIDRDSLAEKVTWHTIAEWEQDHNKIHDGILDTTKGFLKESYVSEAKSPKKEPSVYYSKSEKDKIFREFQRTFNSSKYKAELLLDNMGQLGGRIPSPAIAIIHTRPGFDGDKSNISEICKEATKRSKKYVFKRQAIGSPAFAHFIRYDLPLAIPYPNLAYGIVAYPKSVEKKYRTAAYECFVTEGDLPSVEPIDEASVPLTRPVYTKKMHKKPVNRHITNSKGNHIKKIVSQESYTDWF